MSFKSERENRLLTTLNSVREYFGSLFDACALVCATRAHLEELGGLPTVMKEDRVGGQFEYFDLDRIEIPQSTRLDMTDEFDKVFRKIWNPRSCVINVVCDPQQTCPNLNCPIRKKADVGLGVWKLRLGDGGFAKINERFWRSWV